MNYQPGQFQYPPYPNIPPRNSHRGLLGWYRAMSRKAKVGLGCGVLILILAFFSCIGAAFSSSKIASFPTPTTPAQQTAVPNSPIVQQQEAVTKTVAPTSVPTHLPTKTPIPSPAPKPTLAPTHAPQPTQPPAHTPTPCPGINCNPWGYNFTPGKLIYYPPTNFCSYFNCISSFWEPDDPGDGYVVQCVDGTFSQSGGERGACSYHGGVSRPLYSH